MRPSAERRPLVDVDPPDPHIKTAESVPDEARSARAEWPGRAAQDAARVTRQDGQGSLGTKRLAGAIALIGAVIGALSGTAALFDWFGAKVDPPTPPPPRVIDAQIASVDLRSKDQRLLDYLRETNQPTAGLSRYEGAEEGYVFRVRVRIQGNQGQPLPLRWALIDVKTGKRLAGPTYNQTAVIFKPRGPNQARTWPIWVPRPPRAGAFRLRATLVDGKRQPLDEADSQIFTLRRAPSP